MNIGTPLHSKMEKENLDGSITFRYSTKQMQLLSNALGLEDVSKVIRACMSCTFFVTHALFGGNLQGIFKRDRNNENKALFNFAFENSNFVMQKK